MHTGRRGGARASAVALLGLVACVAACGSGSEASTKAVQAAVNVGMAAAAMPLHQAIHGCLTQCGYGTGCDEDTGTCEPLEAIAKKRKSKAPLVAGDPSQTPLEPIPFAFDESCAGLCLSDERCVMQRGDLECVPRLAGDVRAQ